MLKVVSAEMMRKAEANYKSLHENFMQNIGKKVAKEIQNFIEKHSLERKVTLLVGKGNNGGDCFSVGSYLLDLNFEVVAIHPFKSSQTSSLNQKFRTQYEKKGGKFSENFFSSGIILDGFLGTGFAKSVEPVLAEYILQANQQKLPIFSIDVPSGLNSNSGVADPHTIHADRTFCLGFPKIGYFINDGWNFVGKITLIDFGMPASLIEEVEPIALFPPRVEMPKILRTRHKYDAGYVLALGGSAKYPNAIKLSGLGALRVGAGIVNIFSKDDLGALPLELIYSKFTKKEFQSELKRAKSLVIGPGIGKSNVKKTFLKKLFSKIHIPLVIDADALLSGITYPKHAILTPHKQEVCRLLDLDAVPQDEHLFAKIIKFCNHTQTFILLKGAPTFLFGPKRIPIIIEEGDPGMATAGSGDVLAGVLAGLLAQGLCPWEAMILGAKLHASAGEIAALHKTSYSMIASDIIACLPEAIKGILKV
jgi:hydroxyethylthiazole kinase-like uncharacterized protein yjeF